MAKLRNSFIPSTGKKWEDYFSYPISKTLSKINSGPEECFDEEGKKMELRLFHAMAERVPAYVDFLKKNKIIASKIKKHKDLDGIPCLDKENYLKKNALSRLCWDGKLNSPIISASSGTSGVPSFWPRSTEIEMETSFVYEMFLKNIFQIDKYKTLLINGFSMGIYVGGSFTLNCSMRLFQKGYPLTIITPGINKGEIIHILKNLSSEFEQVILGGYPPFLRDILDDCEDQGINLKKKNIKFFFASEALSETFRSYLYSKVGVREKDYYSSSMNLYGTADAAIAGHETPTTTFVRKLFSGNLEECMDVFGTDYVPSLNQYYPFFKYFQIIDNEVVFSSANNQIPLLKYNIHDRGKIFSFSELMKIVKSFGINQKDMEKALGKSGIWRLPTVCLFGRSDLSVTIYGLNIYPEHIKMALESPLLKDSITGKFIMQTKNRAKDQGQYLEFYIELKGDIKSNKQLEDQIKETLIKTLRKVNVEYNHLCQAIKEKADPKITLCKKGLEPYFSMQTKHKWIFKQ